MNYEKEAEMFYKISDYWKSQNDYHRNIRDYIPTEIIITDLEKTLSFLIGNGQMRILNKNILYLEDYLYYLDFSYINIFLFLKSNNGDTNISLLTKLRETKFFEKVVCSDKSVWKSVFPCKVLYKGLYVPVINKNDPSFNALNRTETRMYLFMLNEGDFNYFGGFYSERDGKMTVTKIFDMYDRELNAPMYYDRFRDLLRFGFLISII